MSALAQTQAALAADPGTPIRVQIIFTVAKLNEAGERSTPAHIARALGLEPGRVRSVLSRLTKSMTTLVSVDGDYRLLVGETVSIATRTVSETARTVSIATRAVSETTRRVDRDTVAPETASKTEPDAISKEIYTPPYSPPPPTTESAGPGLAGRLGSDLGRHSHAAPCSDPMEGIGEDRPAETPQPNEPPPHGWFVGVCNLLASKMPRRRGRHGVHLSPMTPDQERRISQAIIAGGGWRAFDMLVRPLLVDFDKEIKSPHGLIAHLFKQAKGSPQGRARQKGGAELGWVHTKYLEIMSPRRAAVEAVSDILWGAKITERFEPCLAWIRANLDDREVLAATHNGERPCWRLPDDLKAEVRRRMQ